MSLHQTPVPQEIRIELPEYTLVIPDTSKPVWFGEYFSGKLGIYKADQEVAGILQDSEEENIYISILIHEENDEELNFLSYSKYEKSMSAEDVCTHLLNNVWTAYQNQVRLQSQSMLMPASNTVH